jgi:hypothetical protein
VNFISTIVDRILVLKVITTLGLSGLGENPEGNEILKAWMNHGCL